MIAPARRELRSVERAEFREWIAQLNAERTRIVGWVLLLFGVLALALSFFGVLSPATEYYVSFGVGLAAGTTLITVGLHRSAPAARLAGEAIVLAVAILWMFASVRGNLDNYGGLLHFIIGILALALMRTMRPAVGAASFLLLLIGYATLLLGHGASSAAPPFNALVFCTFAAIWTRTNYLEKVGQFRNSKLLEESHQQARQLEVLTARDALTGLPNRRFFDTLFTCRWEDTDRSREPFSLIVLDVDGFKAYNDAHGHPAGDQCLQAVARVLSSTLASRGVCMRIGGDEFAVVPDYDPSVRPRCLADSLVKAVREETGMTVSAGLSTVTPSTTSADAVYRRADRALYRAKALGRNRVEELNDDQSRDGT